MTIIYLNTFLSSVVTVFQYFRIFPAPSNCHVEEEVPALLQGQHNVEPSQSGVQEASGRAGGCERASPAPALVKSQGLSSTGTSELQ